MKKESGISAELVKSGDIQRDFDIRTLTLVRSIAEAVSKSHLVLTGSYAIETLIETAVNHNDIDTNIFTSDLKQDLPLIASALTGEDGLIPFRETESRLEYDVLPRLSSLTTRRLEIQFIEISGLIEDNSNLEFLLGSDSRHVRVPTIILPLRDSTGHENLFRVKSLPFAIATWAIRISGFAQNPKRNIEDRDLDYLRLLLTRKYNEEEVIQAINGHPQVPGNISADYILNKAKHAVA